MNFKIQLGQTKGLFDNQGKNAMQCIAFSIGILLIKIEKNSWNRIMQQTFFDKIIRIGYDQACISKSVKIRSH